MKRLLILLIITTFVIACAREDIQRSCRYEDGKVLDDEEVDFGEKELTEENMTKEQKENLM